jgi:hypothetical protein
MNAEYSRDEDCMIIKVTMGQIGNYLDAVEGDKGENACSSQLYGGMQIESYK